MHRFRLVLVLLLASCADIKHAGGYVAGSVVEYTACPAGLIDCGHVFECEATAENELGHVEVCINDDQAGQLEAAEVKYGSCVPTPRHQGLCRFICPPETGRGCNALSGCACPPLMLVP